MMSVKEFDNTMKGYLSFLKNPYISTGLIIFGLLYASLAAPKLPYYIAKLFDNVFFKLMIFFLIAYVAQESPTVALVAAIGVMVSIQTLTRYKFDQEMMMSVGSNNKMNYSCTTSDNTNISLTIEQHQIIADAKNMMEEGKQMMEEGREEEGKQMIQEGVSIIEQVRSALGIQEIPPSESEQQMMPEEIQQMASEGQQMIEEGKKLMEEGYQEEAAQFIDVGQYILDSAQILMGTDLSEEIYVNNSENKSEMENMVEEARNMIEEGRRMIQEDGLVEEGQQMIQEGKSLLDDIRQYNGTTTQENFQEQEQEQEQIRAQAQDNEKMSEENMMEEKVAQVVREVRKMEEQTGQKAQPEEIRMMCTRVNDVYAFKMTSLVDLYDTYKPKLTTSSNQPVGITDGYNNDVGNYASVAN